MERVIVLSKFKTFINRLFGETDIPAEDEHETIDKEKQMQQEKQREDREQPTFRFPIITDAEIYGWDDSIKDREYVESPVPAVENTVDDDDYEPIPLFENERWPKQKAPDNIFRATIGPSIQEELKPAEHTILFNETEVDDHVTTIPRPMGTVHKKTNKRFIPSTVPSPIHGFSAKRTLDNEAVIDVARKQVKKVEPVIQDVFSEPKENKEIETVKVTKEIIERQELEKLEKLEKLEELEELDEIDKLEEPQRLEVPKKPKDDELERVRIKEKEGQVERKEKIVPFNVIMLKSDKEKLAGFVKSKEAIAELVTPKEPQPSASTVGREIADEPVEDIAVEIVEEVEELAHYIFPSIDLLIPPEKQIEDTEWLDSQSEKLEESLSHFGVQATVIEAVQGPTVTLFELTVGQGTKVSRVRNLTDDLKLALAAEDIRIQAPIPGKSSIGIEIPNKKTRPVRISEVITTAEFSDSTSPLEAVLGLSLTGKPVTLDLRKMPHGMIAGATGSGKSVCINSILISLLYKASPTDLKMMLIDPKMVELAPFNGIPHLISPVITDVKAATAALKWAVAEMERRYELLAHAGVRDIERYNKAAIESRQFSRKMPYLLIVIDELSDLMMMAPADVEISISRIAQKARACGIHLIIATQRPSVDVITGTIKANIPTRIAFSVSSQVDSRTIIDSVGAERLLGKGDMLYIGNGQSSGVRLQGTFVTDDEIERIIEHVQREASPTYLFGQDDLLKSAVEEEENDPLFEDACLFIFEQETASTSLLQRNFSIGYNRAAKLMDRIEQRGFISEQRGSRARDVLLTEKDLEQLSETVN